MGVFERGLGVCAVVEGTARANVLASAATIGINASVLTSFAETGNDVLAIAPASPTTLGFCGLKLDVVAPGCTGSAECSMAGLTEVRINMLRGDDVVEASGVPMIASLTFLVLGGDGNDVLIGGASAHGMDGGTGDDVLIAGSGPGCLSGGPGRNVVIGPACADNTEPVFSPAQPVDVPEPASWLLLLPAALAGAAGR